MSKHVLKCWYLILNAYTVKSRAGDQSIKFPWKSLATNWDVLLATLRYLNNSYESSKIAYNQYNINRYNSYYQTCQNLFRTDTIRINTNMNRTTRKANGQKSSLKKLKLWLFEILVSYEMDIVDRSLWCINSH